MPEEVLILFIMTIVSLTTLTLVKMILSHRKSKSNDRNSSEGSNSMTTSELEGIMQRSVEKAISGLNGKIEALEGEVSRLATSKPRLVAHQASEMLELPDEIVELEPLPLRTPKEPKA